ncbi:hypothetical protein GLA29479_3244 [Lysobacter antibioticus]|nr:hypothetical protein GLA29479_3244 [Lysobacter antibioticus]
MRRERGALIGVRVQAEATRLRYETQQALSRRCCVPLPGIA